jgi:hypothetical protein
MQVVHFKSNVINTQYPWHIYVWSITHELGSLVYLNARQEKYKLQSENFNILNNWADNSMGSHCV